MSESETRVELPNTAVQDLRQWFGLHLGQLLLADEQSRIANILPKLFGYHVLQIDYLGQQDLLASSCISHKILLLFDSENISGNGCSLLGDEQSLAIASDSMDVVVLPHVLEFVPNPHKLLRELERILIGEGHLVLTAFNPWSLLGIWRLILLWREKPPWSGHFYTHARLKDWLSLLDFEIVESHRFFFRPPIQKKTVMQRLSFLEKLGKYCWPVFGGVYVIVAKKRVVPLTPIKMRWHARRQLISSGLVEPSARSHEEI
jgi:SAM-dependent methyltransferase